MKNYEVFFIIEPSIDETGLSGIIDKLKKHIESFGGNIKDIKDNGIETLAYEINKSKQSHNIIFYIEIDPLKLEELKKEIKLESKVWRYFIKSLT